jgi:hypothetical protein
VKFIDDVKTQFYRLWTIRISIAFSVFTALAASLGALASALDPYVLVALSVIFNGVLIPLLRVLKQAEPEVKDE